MARISSSNKAAVNKVLTGAITEREARALIKSAGGKNKKVNTAKELKQLRAIRAEYKTAFTPAAKRAVDKEIKAAEKRVDAPSRPALSGFTPVRPERNWYSGGSGS